MIILQAYLASTTPLPVLAELSGIPEVPSGNSSPTQSPPLAAIAASHTKHSGSRNARARRGGAAFTITEECERLFCETLKTTFLGEGDLDLQNSLVMGSLDIGSISNTMERTQTSSLHYAVGHGSPDTLPSLSSFDSGPTKHRLVTHWLEMWDYAGGARFRGFIADDGYSKNMFVFFDKQVLGTDLKPGLMALLELCNVPEVDCSKLVVSVDKDLAADDAKGLLRDLGWVGFEAITLDEWSNKVDTISNKWMFLSMET